jgi:hypothetical protein
MFSPTTSAVLAILQQHTPASGTLKIYAQRAYFNSITIHGKEYPVWEKVL